MVGVQIKKTYRVYAIKFRYLKIGCVINRVRVLSTKIRFMLYRVPFVNDSKSSLILLETLFVSLRTVALFLSVQIIG